MRSDKTKKGIERAPHRSLMRATGMTSEDIKKPFIAICNSFNEVIPGHAHLDQVGKLVKQAVREAGECSAIKVSASRISTAALYAANNPSGVDGSPTAARAARMVRSSISRSPVPSSSVGPGWRTSCRRARGSDGS